MSQMETSTFSYISRKCGRKLTECKCVRCRNQCHTPCLGTPEDISKLIEAGYQDRLAPTQWMVGMLMKVHDRPILMVQPKVEGNGWCTFYHDGLCELHDLGLKPTEGKLSHHTTALDSLCFRRNPAWLVAKEWIP